MLERFWSKVNTLPGNGPKGDCWIWVASYKSGKYGSFRVGKKCEYAHRIAFQEANNVQLEDDDNICHTCDYPPCVRPSHLFKDTHIGNMADRAKKGRQPKGEKHHEARLTEELIRQAYKSWKTGLAISVIAKSLNVTYSTLYDAFTGRNWKHLELD